MCVMSIQSSYLVEIANKVDTDVTRVLVNDSIVITSFLLHLVSGNTYTLTFNVTQVQTNQITNIKLQKTNGTTISDVTVSIPITTSYITITGTITISEVIS